MKFLRHVIVVVAGLSAGLSVVLTASALGQLKDAAGSNGGFVPPVSAPQAGDTFFGHTDASAQGTVWYLHCDCSTCDRHWYPDPHPTKGPYSSESACQGDLSQAQNRAGASSCERLYCEQSGGGAAESGGGGVKGTTQDALRAAQALSQHNQVDNGHDLLGPVETGDDTVRFGMGQGVHSFPKLGDGPLQVLILKLEPWCKRALPEGHGAKARARARDEASNLATLLGQARQRLDAADAPFQQRQRALRLIECGERQQQQLQALAEPAELKAHAAALPRAASEDAHGAPQLLRGPGDKGEAMDRPYVNCATYAEVAQRLRSGLAKQRATIEITEVQLSGAESDAAQAHHMGHDQVVAFAKDELKGAATEYLKRIRAAEKSANFAMKRAGLNQEQVQLLKDFKSQIDKTRERTEQLETAGREYDRFENAGGVRTYLGETLNDLQTGAQKIMHDPAMREALLSQAGEGLASMGGPAAALGFRAVKTDIDLTALALSQGLDEKQAATHRQALAVLKQQLNRSEDTIRFLEEEGKNQCP